MVRPIPDADPGRRARTTARVLVVAGCRVAAVPMVAVAVLYVRRVNVYYERHMTAP